MNFFISLKQIPGNADYMYVNTCEIVTAAVKKSRPVSADNQQFAYSPRFIELLPLIVARSVFRLFEFERDRERKMAGGEEEITMVSSLTLDTSLVKSESEQGQQVSLPPIERVFRLLLVRRICL